MRLQQCLLIIKVGWDGGLGYVHLQKSTAAIESVEAKDAFERYEASQGVYIHHYHADKCRQ